MLFEPTHKDEFEFISKITGSSISKEYIPGIKRGLESVITSGPVLGYPIIRLKVTLMDGEHHDVDSSILAFEIAAKQCLRQAVQRVGGMYSWTNYENWNIYSWYIPWWCYKWFKR